MATTDPYLFFDGNCAEAMRFYEKTLGARIEMMMKGADMPGGEKMPPGGADKIMHARLALGDGRVLMASDWGGPGGPYPGMSGFAVSVSLSKVADARRVFDALAHGGKVNMPMAETFWSQAFGMLVDRFGTPWMVSGPEKK